MNKRVLAYVLFSLLISCDYGRISSKVRFEQASNTKIPNGFKVIKDNYDGQKDYTITYIIDFNDVSSKQYVENIKRSGLLYTSLATMYDSIHEIAQKGKWDKTENGFIFQRNSDKTFYSITFDTITKRASFEETVN